MKQSQHLLLDRPERDPFPVELDGHELAGQQLYAEIDLSRAGTDPARDLRLSESARVGIFPKSS